MKPSPLQRSGHRRRGIELVRGENEQGIDLKKGGEASSINMATLQYETWVKDGDRLILSGRSIGNGTTIPFTDTLVIEKLTDDELSLKKGELVIRYKKQE
ncbi:MAG: lipocalin family protein [Alistipes onderdonkii]